MGIQIISISHKIAPLHVREMFAFTEEQQKHMMQEITEHLEVSECIVLSTCNRTEMYVYSDSESKGCVFNLMEDVLLGEAGAQDEEDIGNYLLFYHGKKAIHHLFQVAAGLDSMVIGEDQILGQVKTAHKQAREAGTTGVYLNTFFRMAVTGAKKVKTETELSKTSVSTATLALKVAEEELGTLKDKKVLIIGATGKIGGIVLMNIQSLHQADIYFTTRKNKLIQTKHGNDEFTTIDYEDRYEYLDQMDVVISATSSPHYTLTYSKMKKQLTTAKRRVFVDLAVPEAASGILDEYELQFEQWMVFQKSLSVMGKVRDNFVKVAEHKGVEKAFDHFFYWVRENNTPEDLETFFQCLDH